MEVDLTSAQAAVVEQPYKAALWCKLGSAHYARAGAGPDHYLEAHLALERALNMAPTMPIAALGFGASAYTFGQYNIALEMFRRAQQSSEGAHHPFARLSEGGLLLRMGRYKEGWEKIEARLELPAVRVTGTYQGPLSRTPPYRGTLADLAGKTVFVRGEQGFGDNIQFMRYVPQLRPFCADILLESLPSMTTLFHEFLPGVTTVDETDLIPGTVPISILSLPLLLGEKIGWEPIAPLPVPPKLAPWKMPTKIGVCPASTADTQTTIRKNPPMEMFDGLAPNVVSLMHGDLQTENWLETARIMRGLSRVISVDTAIAHLAASMGLETWLLQRFDDCWRWNDGWYSTVRIFKQAYPGDWVSVFRQVHEALALRE